jgi:transposase
MLTLGFSRRIFLRRGATDMRKSFDSLAGLVRSEFAADPLSGDAFVFVGKAVNRVKILVFDRSGFWVLSKRLSSGHFGVAGRWQAGGDAKAVRAELSSAELQLLLEGIEPKHGDSPTIRAPARCQHDPNVVTSRGLSAFYSQDVRCSGKKFFQECGPSRWGGPLLRSG